ncbi:MAG: hypothetical protein A2418_00900 [Candidatus Brennerbacteria bacterium RIFOXYC1_FULL_41_11]|nr:MAG: hypothetical protein A2418_00900 [Candidatus Brennerbacteria bacterium RIFOXYC1_FULL_41_11]
MPLNFIQDKILKIIKGKDEVKFPFPNLKFVIWILEFHTVVPPCFIAIISNRILAAKGHQSNV